MKREYGRVGYTTLRLELMMFSLHLKLECTYRSTPFTRISSYHTINVMLTMDLISGPLNGLVDKKTPVLLVNMDKHMLSLISAI